MISQTGFILSFLKYGDSDAILHCFTLEEGFQSFFLKSVLTQKNKKKALILPLSMLSFNCRKSKPGVEINYVLKFELEQSYDFYTDIKANTIVFFVSDFLNQVLKHENSNPNIFRAIIEFNQNLDARNYRAHLVLLILLLKIQGIAPLQSSFEYLDPETGNFNLNGTHHLFTKEISSLWKKISTSENPYEIKIKTSDRKQLLDSILVYYHYHFTDFRIPNSLEIIQQIYE
ncbi:recombination protein O N-terminal domain-containing protein [Chryseobacterium sp. Leaf394]|uniref:DNA repair protein RecO n=1 Tax=Chryseobacterium sp. Leaf394 TaxID=1736361 RepID=UPI0006F47925|nr:recombination protein O N-terminal domain-containing protein [Chryseobacterium sp. Leaf394]KQS91310.1 DNA repair protein RecO [Chryseobacterium sp. Leaf394]